MRDYTPEGIAISQLNTANSYLYLIDKKLKKINRSLKIMTAIAVIVSLYKNKDKIKSITL